MERAARPFSGDQRARIVEAIATGCGAPPWNLIETRLVERTGWTFEEIDDQPADRVFALLQIWGLQAGMGNG